MEQQIVYSMRVMAMLVSKGFTPLTTMPNPKNSKYTSWIFTRSPEFDAALAEILEVVKK